MNRRDIALFFHVFHARVYDNTLGSWLLSRLSIKLEGSIRLYGLFLSFWTRAETIRLAMTNLAVFLSWPGLGRRWDDESQMRSPAVRTNENCADAETDVRSLTDSVLTSSGEPYMPAGPCNRLLTKRLHAFAPDGTLPVLTA